MEINKALEHFKWKFENSWKPTEKDIEAFNSIVQFKEFNESVNLSENELLAKLWIHQLILLNNTNMYSAEQAIQTIDDVLKRSVHDWCVELKEQSPIMKFNTNQNTATDKELLKMLKSDVKLEDIIKFVEKHITRILIKY